MSRATSFPSPGFKPARRWLLLMLAVCGMHVPTLDARADADLTIPLVGEASNRTLRAVDAPPQAARGCASFTVEQPREIPAVRCRVTDFGASPTNADNWGPFHQAIAFCQKQARSILTIPTGVYRFTNESTLTFKDLCDFELEGGQSELIWYKQRGDMIALLSCQRSVFRNLTIDWDWALDPLGSVVKVNAIGPQGEWIDLVFTAYARFPRRQLRVAAIDKLDPQTRSPGGERSYVGGYENRQGRDAPARYEWLSDNTLRLFANGAQAMSRFSRFTSPGDLLRLRHRGFDGIAAFYLNHNAHLTLSNISVFGAPGQAFLVGAGEQHHWQLLECRVVPRPGSSRPLSVTADGLHLVSSTGYLKLQGCEFGFLADDGVNLHDRSAIGARLDDHRLSITLKPTSGIAAKYQAGDVLELREANLAPTGFRAKIASVKTPEPGCLELAFTGALPRPRQDFFILYNWRFNTEHILIRDCFFHDNSGHGLLLLARNATVERCRFDHTLYAALKLQSGYTTNTWSEGYGVSNLLIRSNSFKQAYATQWPPWNERQPAIILKSYLRTDPSTERAGAPILEDICIEDNRFEALPGLALEVSTTRNLLFRGNRIGRIHPWADAENPFVPGETNRDYAADIAVRESSAIFIWSNSWEEPGRVPYLRLQDAAALPNVHYSGNRGQTAH